ncbi:hypothetical protein HN011_010250 [Eciton burchellii]|nr:hypothetical protein HN011_010250 [Eciton burchellii]
MILLYYANYAVAAHGQWCILMAIVAQRGAIAIDQSCSGYANSRAQPGEGRARRATRRWRGLMEDDGNARTTTTDANRRNDIEAPSKGPFCRRFASATSQRAWRLA